MDNNHNDLILSYRYGCLLFNKSVYCRVKKFVCMLIHSVYKLAIAMVTYVAVQPDACALDHETEPETDHECMLVLHVYSYCDNERVALCSYVGVCLSIFGHKL